MGDSSILALLDVPLEIQECFGEVALSASGPLEARSGTFSYIQGTQVLTDINLSIQPGKTLALVGHTGAGKSTLARLYDPE
ncbi:MAG: ATP-binding cassette domain-containing protein [Caldilineaceae bacterium SB0661_bin_32]|uniref:ATP-binding cassette domain-containing protein n=1 Tax=Caldilineaceae bacterium SB0661_bin_32 TaxID=2605255 RepID=A0A6B1DCD7_9CHLR|nr:ATP-binding cassette domain-containing protein [Caldilineaceae bacterium SB0661_bin_32]